MPELAKENALEHVVVVLFENRSLDNVLGLLYGPDGDKSFEGVIGKNLSNPIPEWSEDGADRKVVPYTVAADMDSPKPDSGEEDPHTHAQLFNILSEDNRLKLGVRDRWTYETGPKAGHRLARNPGGSRRCSIALVRYGDNARCRGLPLADEVADLERVP